MNTASRNLEHHLGILRERLLHPTDYERAIHYFLEEFAGDAGFVQQSVPERAPPLLAVLTHVASKAAGKSVTFDEALVSHLPAHRFYHGNATFAGRVVLFIYFQDDNTGVLALVPGNQGGMEVARFKLPGGLPDPRNN